MAVDASSAASVVIKPLPVDSEHNRADVAVKPWSRVVGSPGYRHLTVTTHNRRARPRPQAMFAAVVTCVAGRRCWG
jgi:hypothetical protein